MMQRRQIVHIPTILALVILCCGSVSAQLLGPGLVSEIEAKRNGLQRRWFSQVQLNTATTRVVGVVLHVSSTDATTIYEIKHKGGVHRISSKQFDYLGREIGEDGAKKLAEQKELYYKAAGLEPEMTRIVQPEITLYASTDRGMIHAIDGESGRTKWRALIGRPDHTTLRPAANDRYVAAVNGSYLYMLDRNTGRQLWRRRVVSSPGAGPVVSDEMAFVPMVDGRLESFLLSDYKHPTGIFQSIGRSFVSPTITERHVVWPTDRGHLYVAPNNRKGILYRIEARDAIVCPAAFQEPNTLYTVSIDGYVYSVHETSGRLQWSYSIGEQISHEPIPMGEQVVVITDLDNMIALNAETGYPVWKTPQIRGFISASQDRIYAVNKIGRLTIMDRKTGSILSSMQTEELDLKFLNQQTDRIYIGTSRGLIQCLHEPRNEFPLIRQDEASKAEEQPSDPGTPDGEKPASDDPFAQKGIDNPFAPKTPAAPMGDDDDPFGAAKPDPAKPAPPKPKADDNPFGL